MPRGAWPDEPRQPEGNAEQSLPAFAGTYPKSNELLDDVLQIPADWRPWWHEATSHTLLGRPQRLEMTADAVALGSLVHSAHVRLLRDAPAIQQTVIAEASAQFDFRSYMESKFIDTSEPVGSTLTTGGPPRYLDQNWSYSAGVRKLGETGARLEASQRFGYEDSNSVFFLPEQQGTARLSLSLTQPLLNGAGRMYNTSTVMLARIDAEVAQDKFARDLQNVLIEVHRTYWDLYRERVALLQRRKLLSQARRIYDELQGRREVDVLKSQIARARAAVATRDAAVVRQQALVLNAEAKLRMLVNDPALGTVNLRELIPVQPPIESPQEVALEDSLVLALQSRPEIDQAAREIRAASVRLDVSTNELMPVLNLILASYVSGLEGDANLGGAWADQFATGRPTYSAGLLFEYPLGNRGAQARLQKQRLELRQLTNQLEVTAAAVRLEVETAVREIATAHREMSSHYHAIVSGEAEIEHLERRWRLLPGDQQVAGIVLDDLLNAQERLGRAEASYVAALTAYNLALVQLKRATGVLLQYQPAEAAPHLLGNGVAQRGKKQATPGDAAVAAIPPESSDVARRQRPRSIWPMTADSSPAPKSRSHARVQPLPPLDDSVVPLPTVEAGPLFPEPARNQ